MSESAYYPHLVPYRNTHKGQACVILGTGMTIKGGVPEDVLRDRTVLSVNSIIFHPALADRVDYYFIQDKGRAHEEHGYSNNVDRYDRYQPELQKFYGIGPTHAFDAETAGRGHAKWYRVARGPWANDLANDVLGDFGTVIFVPMQFAAYMGFTDWIIAGCDLEGARFSGGNPIFAPMLKSWKEEAARIKSFGCVRVWKPLGLRGMFDEFTG